MSVRAGEPSDQERLRADELAGEVDLEVKMRPSRASGVAATHDRLTGLDSGPGRDFQDRRVAVRVPGAVIGVDRDAVAARR